MIHEHDSRMKPQLHPLPTSKNLLGLQLKIHHQTKTYLPEELQLNYGIRNPLQLIAFFKTHEGKAMLAEAQAHIELEAMEQEQLEFAQEDYFLQLYRHLIQRLIARMHNQAHTRAQRLEAAEILLKLFLEQNLLETTITQEKLEHSIQTYQLEYEHELEQTTLDYQLKLDIMTQEIEALKSLQLLIHPTLHQLRLQPQDQALLQVLKRALEQEIKALPSAPQPLPAAQLAPQLRFNPRLNTSRELQAQFKQQVQQLRAQACHTMIQELSQPRLVQALHQFEHQLTASPLQRQRLFYQQQIHNLQLQRKQIQDLRINDLLAVAPSSRSVKNKLHPNIRSFSNLPRP
jgi:hypothetical protein